jgi:hypothetical protein
MRTTFCFYDPALTAVVKQQQKEFISSSIVVDVKTAAQWNWPRRLRNNTAAMLGTLL